MTIKIVIKHNREISFQASPFQKWKCNMSGADVWIDCPTCELSIGARNDGIIITDDEFVDLVRKEGWEFIPNKHIACPSCKEKDIKNKTGHKCI